jgi:hypothetical protein
MSSSSTLALAELRDGPLYRFADWPNPEVLNGRIDVYAVWGGDELIDVGMGGRAVGPSADTDGPASTKLTGLRSRLASRASGRRPGGQFCIYVFDRLVLPTLGLQQIRNAARGQLSLDGLTWQLIRQSLCYRFTLVGDAIAARRGEGNPTRRAGQQAATAQPATQILQSQQLMTAAKPLGNAHLG